MTSPELQAFAAGFPPALLHAAISLVLLFAGAAAYVLTSRQKEFQAIDAGSSAAAITLTGALLGLGIPLAAALLASPAWLEILLWGSTVLVIQLGLFRLVDWLLGGLPERARDGEIAAALVMAAARITTALVLAASVSP